MLTVRLYRRTAWRKVKSWKVNWGFSFEEWQNQTLLELLDFLVYRMQATGSGLMALLQVNIHLQIRLKSAGIFNCILTESSIWMHKAWKEKKHTFWCIHIFLMPFWGCVRKGWDLFDEWGRQSGVRDSSIVLMVLQVLFWNMSHTGKWFQLWMELEKLRWKSNFFFSCTFWYISIFFRHE